jgi:hypothetical protein
MLYQDDKKIIFIHSLFRSGSTYIFNVFRRSAERYWCYQEPLNEAAFYAKTDSNSLISDFYKENVRILRHPSETACYFSELHEVWEAWKDIVTDFSSYNAYFAPKNGDIGIAYLEALVSSSKGRPVFQECRSAGRIKEFCQALGGFHIYLWRNPWDQWWSYKVTPYFDAANQIIINACEPPEAVQILRRSLQLEDYQADEIATALSHFMQNPMSSEESYCVFYLLWCLGLYEGIKNANMLLNIDQLSDSDDYRTKILSQLSEQNIDGLSFDDCNIFQNIYTVKERSFFENLEKKVHSWLLKSGWSQEDLEQILAIRQQFQPAAWFASIKSTNPELLVEQACRARSQSISHETNASTTLRRWRLSLAEAEERARSASERSDEAELFLQQAQTRAQQMEDLAKQADLLAAHSQTVAKEAEAKAQQAEAQAQQAEARTQQAEAQAQQAEAQAQQAEAKAQHAEAQAQHAETKAQHAEAQAQHAEAQAQQAETKAQHAEAQAQQAEARTQQAEAQAQQAEARTQQAEAQAQHAEAQAQHAEVQAQQAEARAQHAEDYAHQLNRLVGVICTSRSWRLTAPLRWLSNQYRLLREHGIRGRSRAFLRKMYGHAASALLSFFSLHSEMKDFSKSDICQLKNNSLSSENDDFSTLSPRARKIYADLDKVITKLNKEQS